MLTAEQAESFLSDRLGIKNWKFRFDSNGIELLKEVDKRFKQVVYYQNLPWGAKELSEAEPPTVEEVISIILESNGGVCLQNNYFMHLLLKYMGYDTFVVGCSTTDVTLRNNHILVIVRFPPPTITGTDWRPVNGYGNDELYMVDVGWVRPIPCTVHLNKLPFSYKAAGFTVRFQYVSQQNNFEFHLIDGDPIKGAFMDDSPWRKYAEFDLIPRKFEDFNHSMTQTFCNPDYGYFLHTVSMVRYISLQSVTENTFVAFRGRNMIVLNPDHMDVTTFDTYEEMYEEILKYFPDLDPKMVLKALQNYEVRQRKYKSVLSINPHATAGVGYKMKYNGQTP